MNMPELTPVKIPITINEAINILAYNDFFYNPGPKSLKSLKITENHGN